MKNLKRTSRKRMLQTVLGALILLPFTAHAQNVFPTPSGNVGIGTTSPGALLDVEGPYGITQVTGDFRIAPYGTGGTTAFVQARNTPSSGNIDLQFRTQSSGNIVDVMKLFSNGRIAFGYPFTPTYHLDIRTPDVDGLGGDEKNLRIKVQDAGNDVFQIKNGTQTDAYFAPLMLGYSHGSSNTPLTIQAGSPDDISGGSPMMSFLVQGMTNPDGGGSIGPISNRPLFDWSNGFSSVMRMLSNGNLGIGTAAPNCKLEVVGPNGHTVAFQVKNSSNVSNFRVFGDGQVGINTPSASAQLQINTNGNTFATHALQINNSNGGIPLFDLFDNGYAGMGVAVPKGKLHIENLDGPNAGLGVIDPVGLYTHVTDVIDNVQVTTYGVKTFVENPEAWAVGVQGEGSGEWTSYGVKGLGHSAEDINFGLYGLGNDGNEAIGVFGQGSDGGYSYGLMGYALGTCINGNAAYGVYGMAKDASINYGVYGTTFPGSCSGATNWAGYFNGAAFCTSGMWTSSDQKLKRNIVPLEGALDKINRLQPKKYEFKQAEYPGMNLPSGQQLGLIAQELEQVFPELVKETTQPASLDKDGKVIQEEVKFKSVNYTGLIPVLVEGIKEQNQQIADLKKELEDMKATLANLSAQSNNGNNSSGTLNSTGNEPILYQNMPNPTNSSTIIRYSVPANDEQAQIVVTDLAGRTEYLRLNLQKGNGQVEIQVGTIPAGTYIYSLIVNGQKVDTKKMIITK